MKQKYLLVLSGVIVVVAILALALILVRSVRSGPQASTPTPPLDGPNPNDVNVLPAMTTAVQPKITDLAPEIPYEDKPAVVVRHADGSREMFLLAPDMLDAFIENLPTGDELKLVLSPPSLTRTQEAP